MRMVFRNKPMTWEIYFLRPNRIILPPLTIIITASSRLQVKRKLIKSFTGGTIKELRIYNFLLTIYSVAWILTISKPFNWLLNLLVFWFLLKKKKRIIWDRCKNNKENFSYKGINEYVNIYWTNSQNTKRKNNSYITLFSINWKRVN